MTVKFKKYMIVEQLIDTYNPTMIPTMRIKLHKLTHTKKYSGALELFKQFLKSPKNKKHAKKDDDGHTELFKLAHDLDINYRELYALAVKKGMMNNG